MKQVGGVELVLHPFVISALDRGGGCLHASYAVRRAKSPRCLSNTSLGGSRSRRRRFAEEKLSSQYSDCAVTLWKATYLPFISVFTPTDTRFGLQKLVYLLTSAGCGDFGNFGDEAS